MRRSPDDYLFHRFDLSDRVRFVKLASLDEVDRVPEDELLSLNPRDFVAAIVARNVPTVPRIFPEQMFLHSDTETTVDVSGRFDYDTDGHGPHYVPGQSVVIGIPFDGDAALLNYKRMYSSVSIVAKVQGNAILLEFADVTLDPADVRQRANTIAGQIQEKLKWISNDYEVMKSELERELPETIERRRDKILGRRNVVSELGLPIRRSDSPAPTFSVPIVRKDRPIPPKQPAAPFQPEPALDEREYDYILTVIERLAISIERNPTAFARMGEEEIRDIVLVDLNGHYEGNATGETFNARGKTDIRISEQGRDAFIAEAKIWSGEIAYLAAIDQMLGYLTWRDTKTALLVFSRNKDFSGVLDTISSATKGHAQFARQLRVRSQSSTTYEFRQPQDSQRSIFLTVIAFSVPPKE
jgi:hypothetical protein